VALLVLTIGLLTLFGAYPIIDAVTRTAKDKSGYNSVNSTGQINKFPNFPSLVDDDTPASALTRVGSDGRTYNLVFSDEFNRDGRTFYPGDDPYWEAVDLHYWPTGDVEWYDPGQITTANGKLVISMERKNIHNLNYASGMLQGWNKFCFTTGYVEVSVSLPGSVNAQGFWPGIWSMGNLVSKLCRF
jgi:beta-glucanase (GH16 family)